MNKSLQSILLVTEEAYDNEIIMRHLAAGYELRSAIDDEDLALRLFYEARPDLLILSFRSITGAERFYLRLARKHPDARYVPHQVFVLCQHQEESEAADLCLNEVVDDYVVSRPHFDVSRLRVAMLQAEGRHRARKELEGVKAMVVKADRGFGELGQLPEQSQARLMEVRDGGARVHQRILGSMTEDLKQLSNRLAAQVDDAGMRGRLRAEVEQFRSQNVRSHFEEHRDGLVAPYESWLGAMNHRVAALARTREDLSIPAPRNILVVDDDLILRSVMRELLEDKGYVVSDASDGREAMGMLSRIPFDAILLDYLMPKMDGIELLRQLRSAEHLAIIPVIMLTSHTERRIVQQCLEAGARDFVVKPVNPAQLYRKLERVLD